MNLHGHVSRRRLRAWTPLGLSIWLAFGTASPVLAQVEDEKPDAQDSVSVPYFADHGSLLEAVACSPDGTLIATVGWHSPGGAEGRLWNAESGELITTLKHHPLDGGPKPDFVWDVSFSSDGRLAATGAQDGAARIWDVSTGELLRVLELNQAAMSYSVSFSPDGSRLMASGDRYHRIWDLRDDAEDEPHQVEGRSPSRFSPDGKVAATYGIRTVTLDDEPVRERVIFLRSPEDGHVIGDLLIDALIKDLAFSPDGSRLVTAGYDGVATTWDLESGTKIADMKGHEAVIMTARFSGDGQWIVTASMDGTVRLWDAETGKSRTVFPRFPMHGGKSLGHPRAAVFMPDQQRILAAVSRYLFILDIPEIQ